MREYRDARKRLQRAKARYINGNGGKSKWKKSEQTLGCYMVLLWALSTGTEKELELSRKLDKTKGTAFREGCLDSMFCHLDRYIKIMTGRTY